jgi:hypothetical protein
MFLTLIVVPVIYSLADGMMARFGLGNPQKKKRVMEQMNEEIRPEAAVAAGNNGHAQTLV